MEKNLSGNSPHRTAITIYKYKVYMTRFEIRWKFHRHFPEKNSVVLGFMNILMKVGVIEKAVGVVLSPPLHIFLSISFHLHQLS